MYGFGRGERKTGDGYSEDFLRGERVAGIRGVVERREAEVVGFRVGWLERESFGSF